jgi:hypothetical protein
MRIDGRGWIARRRSLEALRHEIKYRRGLLARHVELLHDFLIAQSSRFSMTVATGKRVPRNTHAPLTLPGRFQRPHIGTSRELP